MKFQLPQDGYLANLYYEPAVRREIWRVFHNDGRVEAYDGSVWWTVCVFSQEQVASAKQAVLDSGLPMTSDLINPGHFDTAELTYFWKLDGTSDGGVEWKSVTNRCYPIERHPVFIALDRRTDELEAAAGAEWAALFD